MLTSLLRVSHSVGGGGEACPSPHPTIFFENPPIKAEAPPMGRTPHIKMKTPHLKETSPLLPH